MSIYNKITTLRDSSLLTDQIIQTHLDEMNSQGYRLVALDNISGWYRFFWEKDV